MLRPSRARKEAVGKIVGSWGFHDRQADALAASLAVSVYTLPVSDIAPNPAILDDTIPVPPRYWWLKRIMIASAALILALIALRVWWGWYASRHLQAEIDRIIAAGEPIYPEDFDPKEEIPDDQNAAKLYQEAAEKIVLSEKQQKAFDRVYTYDHPLAEHRETILSIFNNNQQAFSLVRQARGLNRFDWGVRIRTPAIETSIPEFSTYRQITKLLNMAAELHFMAGQNDLVVEDFLDSFTLERAMADQPTLISQLVAWAMSAMACSGIERFVLVGAEDAEGTDLEKVRSLITILDSDSHFPDGLHRAFLVERMYQVDLMNELDSGARKMSDIYGWQGGPHVSVPDWVWRYLLQPLLRLDIVRCLRNTTLKIDAIQRANFHDEVFAIIEQPEASLYDVLLSPFDLHQSLNHAVKLYRRCLANRRLAAVGLSVRLYRADKGALPATLQDLIPDYLSSLPIDPQATEPRSFGYLPNHDPPIVYGVADNGVDEGGKYKIEDGVVNSRAVDMPFFLNGDRPVPPPDRSVEGSDSEETGSDDGDVEDHEWDEDHNGGEEEEPEQR